MCLESQIFVNDNFLFKLSHWLLNNTIFFAKKMWITNQTKPNKIEEIPCYENAGKWKIKQMLYRNVSWINNTYWLEISSLQFYLFHSAIHFQNLSRFLTIKNKKHAHVDLTFSFFNQNNSYLTKKFYTWVQI